MIAIGRETIEQGVRLLMKGRMTIQEAHELKQYLLDALLDHNRVDLMVEEISEVDLSGLQLLCSAHRQAEKDGKRLTLSGHNKEEFLNVVRALGFRRETGCLRTGTECLWIEKEKTDESGNKSNIAGVTG